MLILTGNSIFKILTSESIVKFFYYLKLNQSGSFGGRLSGVIDSVEAKSKDNTVELLLTTITTNLN